MLILIINFEIYHAFIWKSESATRRRDQITLSQSFCSSVIAAGDNISGRMLKACPSFIYAGPKEVTISRNSMARATSF